MLLFTNNNLTLSVRVPLPKCSPLYRESVHMCLVYMDNTDCYDNQSISFWLPDFPLSKCGHMCL